MRGCPRHHKIKRFINQPPYDAMILMNFDFMGSKWFLLLITIFLPLLILLIAMLANASVCIMMVIIVWIAVALIVVYLPRYEQ